MRDKEEIDYIFEHCNRNGTCSGCKERDRYLYMICSWHTDWRIEQTILSMINVEDIL